MYRCSLCGDEFKRKHMYPPHGFFKKKDRGLRCVNCQKSMVEELERLKDERDTARRNRLKEMAVEAGMISPPRGGKID